jgi:hypothetical protein
LKENILILWVDSLVAEKIYNRGCHCSFVTQLLGNLHEMDTHLAPTELLAIAGPSKVFPVTGFAYLLTEKAMISRYGLKNKCHLAPASSKVKCASPLGHHFYGLIYLAQFDKSFSTEYTIPGGHTSPLKRAATVPDSILTPPAALQVLTSQEM